jgi:hypothetical protein
VSIAPLVGRPGIGTARTAEYRNVLRALDNARYFPGGGTIDGTKARDPNNTDNARLLRAGTLMGRATSGKKWSNSIIGVTTGAVSATGTTVTVSAAQAAELVRRVGATGTLRLVGPPTAAGTVATFTETYSAVNTTNGQITVSALNADLIAGSFVVADDGTYLPRTMVGDGTGILLPESGDVDYPHLLVAGDVDSSQVLLWPSDTSLQQWIVDQLNASGYGRFAFDHLLGPA